MTPEELTIYEAAKVVVANPCKLALDNLRDACRQKPYYIGPGATSGAFPLMDEEKPPRNIASLGDVKRTTGNATDELDGVKC